MYLPPGAQEGLAWAVRSSVLRPFIAGQRLLAESRLRAQRVDVLQQQLDSLTRALSTVGALADENRTLRSLLELSARVGPTFRAASLLRPGAPGSESLFFVDVGTRDGVREGAPVIDRHGLVGVVREVRGDASVGMDWTHPDFRASAMLADGTGFGVVETRRGAFREDDRLVLNGAAYYESVPEGMPVLTSGLGVLPRGIPIGRVEGVAEAEGRWRKSYWLRPMVEPGAVTHVLVAVGIRPGDLSSIWPVDSILTRSEAILRERSGIDAFSVGVVDPVLPDSIREEDR
ncbi:MAG TPA: rod shape-determining protein MreC [Longimicrobiales bacterium]|nr:rod shape-determining protein MreC [Longimicrobiales bacterium]